ncbi:hypothetical protein GLAREA_10701 [Glarea lozoyensis ATCC 20868]|uniref:Uncharacterized protein n=2 Tax=Glarea lozoyensis TaxID=101852 RepID=S3DSQ9_GLAL2|nr:uncharacterized protein GLAREA_10701 [Glarea lozoyensis ATCC 20868]EHL00175.1 hypothetical protein M7I_3944 [Glarea lozoyensis 74030]EPE35006.1 hypothetical protein GLAREA_10701 [Glarea lozoyensis ATCC 20868]
MTFEFGSGQPAPYNFAMESTVKSFKEPDAAFYADTRDERTKDLEWQIEKLTETKKETARREQRIKELEAENKRLEAMLANNGGASTADKEHSTPEVDKDLRHPRPDHQVQQRLIEVQPNYERVDFNETERLQLCLEETERRMSQMDGDLRKQIEALDTALKESERKQEHQASRDQSAIDQLESQLLESIKEQEDATKGQKALQSRFDKLQARLKETIESRDAHLTRVESLEAALEDARSELYKTVEKKDQELKARKKEIKTLERDLSLANEITVDPVSYGPTTEDIELMKEEWAAEYKSTDQQKDEEIKVLQEKVATYDGIATQNSQSYSDLQLDYDNLLSQFNAMKEESGHFNLDPYAFNPTTLPASMENLVGSEEGGDVEVSELVDAGIQTEEVRGGGESKAGNYTETGTQTKAISDKIVVVPGTPTTVVVHDTITVYGTRQSTFQHIAEVNVGAFRYVAHSLAAVSGKISDLLPLVRSVGDEAGTTSENPEDSLNNIPEPRVPSNNEDKQSPPAEIAPTSSLWDQLRHPLSYPKPEAIPLLWDFFFQIAVLYFLYVCRMVLKEKYIWMEANNITRSYLSDLYKARKQYGRGGLSNILFGDEGGGLTRWLVMGWVDMFGLGIKGFPVPG